MMVLSLFFFVLFRFKEKGKYFNETAILDDDGSYAVSILANEVCEILVLEEEFFNKSVKVSY